MHRHRLIRQGLQLMLVSIVLTGLLLVSRAAGVDPPVEGQTALEGTLSSTPVLNYQGRLLDPVTGDSKPDGSYQMLLGLYSAASGGVALWSETNSVTVDGGLFSVLLGDTTPLNQGDFDGQDLWLGVTVGADPEATPRQRVAWVAYALHAADADSVGGQQASAFAAASHNHDAQYYTEGEANARYVNDGTSEVDNADVADGALSPAKIAGTAWTSTNDGNGSGLDADLLDGKHASAFAESSHSHTGALLDTTVLAVTCGSLASFGNAYSKLKDIGAFTKLEASSTLHITLNGRIAVISLTGTGARFELRVDDAATTNGRARAALKASEVGGDGIPVSMLGVFTGLGAGTHTVSIWVSASSGRLDTGSNAYVDPGCWSSDHVVVQEFR